MDNAPLYPFHEEAGRLERHCKLPLHLGVGRLVRHGDSSHPLSQMFEHFQRLSGKAVVRPSDVEFDASCIVPATGNCLIFLRNQSGVRLNRVFGEGLKIKGESAGGPFELNCPTFHVHATSSSEEDPMWAIASPINCLVSIVYGELRPIAKVRAIINNFDFEYGNVSTQTKRLDQQEIMRVHASGRIVDFERRTEYTRIKQLLDSGILNSTALTTFSFAPLEGASEDQLAAFAHNVASLCSVVAQQHTGIPVLTYLDQEGRVIKRLIGNAIESDFRGNYIIDRGLPNLFGQCFDEHVRMQQTELWRRLPWLCAGIEDPPYLEQKCATLMSALELLLRSSLIESAHCTPDCAQGMMLPDLIGAARKRLRWDIPAHYTERERYRLLRNAVSHGGRLPEEAKQVRHDFDKWRLFLLRRFLIRLGYNGEVCCPQRGFASISPVGDFSEEYNSFET